MRANLWRKRLAAGCAAAVAVVGTTSGIAYADAGHAKPPTGTCPGSKWQLIPTGSATETGQLADFNKNGWLCALEAPRGSATFNYVDDISHSQHP